MLKFTVLAVALVSSGAANAQSFSCRLGTQPACLDYGDKVCSSRGKCVTSDAVCFDSYTCGYKGFVCKSKLDEIVDAHDVVVTKYNTLIDSLDHVQRCVRHSDSVEEAQACFSKLPY